VLVWPRLNDDEPASLSAASVGFVVVGVAKRLCFLILVLASDCLLQLRTMANKVMTSINIAPPTGPAIGDATYSSDGVIPALTFQVQVRARRRQLPAFVQWRLLLAWILMVLMPWTLQTRTFIQLALPHDMPAELVMASFSVGGTQEDQDLETRCPINGLWISGVWWNISPTHYVSSKDRNASDDGANVEEDEDGEARICHFVVPQYNTHGAYHIGTSASDVGDSSSITAAETGLFGSSVTVPSDCRNTSRSLPLLSYYFYHGSIGYYSFFEHGDGVFCASDLTGYVSAPHSLGSADFNGNALALDNNGGGVGESRSYMHRWSRWYVTVSLVLLTFRALVVHRSFLLSMHYGARCKRLGEPLDLRSALIFVNESARLAAHGASNKQRICLIYFLIEGLMGDLFMLVTKDGTSARTQYVSLGYNLASALSLLFEMIESTGWIGERTRCVVRRLFFNVETGLMGELLCAAVLHHYLTQLNRSPVLRLSVKRAKAASFYISSLLGHGAIVVGLVSSILIVRALGALVVAQLSLGSVKALSAPNCVDRALRGRMKHMMLRGYKWRDQNRRHLVYTREALKAFGLLQVRGYQLGEEVDTSTISTSVCDGEEDGIEGPSARTTLGATLFLVQHHAAWFASRRYVRLEAVGRITGEHIEPCSVFTCIGSAAFCDRILGASTFEVDTTVSQRLFTTLPPPAFETPAEVR
jgi:hypothetical protein